MAAARAWLDVHGEFRDQYARARDIQADHFAEEILEIADDGRNDWMQRERKDGPRRSFLITSTSSAPSSVLTRASG